MTGNFIELADAWDAMAADDRDASSYGRGRRETLRECADGIRLVAGIINSPFVGGTILGLNPSYGGGISIVKNIGVGNGGGGVVPTVTLSGAGVGRELPPCPILDIDSRIIEFNATREQQRQPGFWRSLWSMFTAAFRL